jgi:hypothetical protein
MDYNARFYSPRLRKFTQPDTIVPSPANPQSWNRYSYVANNPIKYIDPSGHCSIMAMENDEAGCNGSNLYESNPTLRKFVPKVRDFSIFINPNAPTPYDLYPDTYNYSPPAYSGNGIDKEAFLWAIAGIAVDAIEAMPNDVKIRTFGRTIGTAFIAPAISIPLGIGVTLFPAQQENYRIRKSGGEMHWYHVVGDAAFDIGGFAASEIVVSSSQISYHL